MSEQNVPIVPPGETKRDKLMRLGVVAIVLIAILGGAYIISEQAGLDLVGSGGVNAQLLPKVGDEAPELVVVDTTGQILPLSAFRGTPIWINFWGSWCQPCRAEMPEVIAAYSVLAPKGVLMLGVNEGETMEQAVDYANTVGINFPIVQPIELNTQQLEEAKAEGKVPQLVETTEKWQVNNWPTHIFIDSDGIVQAVVISQLTYDKALAYGAMILPDTLPIASPGGTPVASPEATPAE